MSAKQKTSKISRRHFLRGSALAAGAAATGAVAMPNIAKAQTAVLKVQAAWAGGQIFMENARDYVRR
ncbi:MAG: twin-arginine translocation signal domain-containing protein, partial [bacterium]